MTAELSTTDQILQAVQAYLEHYREDLDRDQSLRSIVVEVKIRPFVGSPRAIVITRKSELEFSIDRRAVVHSA